MKSSNSLRSFYTLLGGLAIIAGTLTWAAPAQAQGRGGGMMGMMRGGQLMSGILTMKEVQEELGLSDEQIEKIAGPAQEINDSMRADMRDIMAGGGDQEEIADMVEEYRKEEQELIGLLDDQQKQRLQELNYQRMGLAMFMVAEVQSALKLSDDQVKSIDDVMATVQDRMRDAAMEARESGDRSAMMAAIQKVQDETTKEITELLTEDQQKQAEEMKGKKFDFPQRQRGNRGGRSDF